MEGLPVFSAETLSFWSTAAIVSSGVALLLGWYFIRLRRDPRRHRTAMLVATSFAALFFFLYAARTAAYGPQPFRGTGLWRALYLANLAPHALLALALGPLLLRVWYLALLRGDFAAHRRLARRVLPLWLYVAASGWFAYYLLHVRRY